MTGTEDHQGRRGTVRRRLHPSRSGRSRLSRGRRWASRVLGLAAAGLGVAVLAPSVVRAQTPVPNTWSGTAAAAALHEEQNSQAGVGPIYQPFYGSFADGLTSFTENAIQARASTFYPGATVDKPNSLFCQFNCLPLSPYPLSVETDGSPETVTESTSPAGGGAAVAPAGATATAVPTGADPTTGGISPGHGSTRAQDTNVSQPAAAGAGASSPGGGASTSSPRSGSAADSIASLALDRRVAAAASNFRRQVNAILRPPGSGTSVAAAGGGSTTTAAPMGMVDARSLTGSTAQAFQGSTLVVQASSAASGVSLLDGLINIGSVRTSMTARSDQAKPVVSVAVNDITVAGMPATIDDRGITVGSASTGSGILDALNGALQQALAAAGAQVRLVGMTRDPAQPLGGCPAGEADGVRVHVQANLSSAPVVGDVYYGDYTLGAACAAASSADNPAGASGATGANGTSNPAGEGQSSGAAALTTGAPGSSSGGSLPAVSGAVPGAGGFPSASTGAAGAAGPPGAVAAGPAAVAVREPVRNASGAGRSPSTLDAVVTHRLSILYLAMTLAFLALLLGARVTLPSRWPAAGR